MNRVLCLPDGPRHKKNYSEKSSKYFSSNSMNVFVLLIKNVLVLKNFVKIGLSEVDRFCLKTKTK
jgi:hypothetical protein